MKKLSVRSFAAGLLAGLFSCTTVLAAGSIYSAQYKDINVTLNGEKIQLNNKFVLIADESDKAYAKTYMPLRELLENLGYSVKWDSENTVNLEQNTWIEGDSIIRKRYIHVGSARYTVEFEENTAAGFKWECTIPADSGFTLVKDEYPDGMTGEKAKHVLSFSIPRDFMPDSGRPVIIFEQTLNGAKTGDKVVYEFVSTVMGGE